MPPRTAFHLPLQQFFRPPLPPGPLRQCLHSLPRRRPQSRPPPSHLTLPSLRRNGTFAGNARALFRSNPITTSLASFAILCGVGALIYTNYYYQTYIIGAFQKYPEPVAKKLRRALYNHNIDFQPQEALDYYKQALQAADEVGMDPFSDEVIGIKIQLAKLLEDAHTYGGAAEVLEIVRAESLEWIRRFGDKDNSPERKRYCTRLLAKCVAASVKLGELYGNPVLWDRDTAEERLLWAVETVVKERQRREEIRKIHGWTEEQMNEEHGPWMTESEAGAAFEALAHTYEARDQHFLAAPLFLQALTQLPSATRDCHAVVLMNNLASSVAQQSPRAARAAVESVSMVENARQWAQKALELAANIKPPDRNSECDVGCAVATHNLGEFAEMLGDLAEAQRRYEEALSLARAIGFQEGVENTSARLKQLKEKDGGRF
ncbi:hypothetical protein M433DRAFT_71363 [Acidomyces richmondensis BFW]|nr:MAG: hypothetical protein FE78DRAFT_154669 [Acidomyces sp. 'richmondensis']KYG43572.1 hypothetical protein M433DRAFT_71363 [Acidomyces richmondensis BFW]